MRINRERVRLQGDAVVTVRVLRDRSALSFLEDRWPMLYRQDAMATPYQSPEWLAGWTEQMSPTATPLVMVADDSDGPVAALALVRDQSEGREQVRPLSSPHAEYIRAVGPGSEEHSVGAALAQCLRVLAREGDCVVMPDVPTDSCLGRHVAAQSGYDHTTARCAVIGLPVDFSAMSRATRKEHKRRERTWVGLAAGGHRVVYRRTRSTAELIGTYPVLSELYHRRWAGHVPLSEVGAAGADKQWQAVLERCGSGTAFIATLAVDEAVVAAQLCLYRHRRCYSVRPAMDPAYRELAPGHALLRRLTAELSGQGFISFDLGRTVEDAGQIAYKSQYLAEWKATLTAISRIPQEAPRVRSLSVPSVTGPLMPGGRARLGSRQVRRRRALRKLPRDAARFPTPCFVRFAHGIRQRAVLQACQHAYAAS
ncbi:GNAT family N-acetyltransferase [Streptomyces sp. 7N604]|uniref:GNAT family N-acetyltransferase n=1 Tax=Streptomyces sp. 7N604 TaxID=3457415 RepID=UPI003FD083B0